MGKHDVLSFAGKALPIIGDTGALLISGTNKPNAMTIGWALASVMWGRNVFVAPVRPSRYSHKLLEAHKEFTVFVPYADMKNVIGICGSKSGRDVDKLALCGLHTLPSKTVDVPRIDADGLVFECRIIYQNDLSGSALPPDVLNRFYTGVDAGNFHTLYFGEILAAYETKTP